MLTNPTLLASSLTELFWLKKCTVLFRTALLYNYEHLKAHETKAKKPQSRKTIDCLQQKNQRDIVARSSS